MSKLPILMYHNVTDKIKLSNGLTICVEHLEQQLQFLVNNNYKTFHLSELEIITEIPKKSIVITFDDVTCNQLEFALPLLKKYNLKATFFVPFLFIGQADLWNDGSQKIMNIAQLKSLDGLIELGLHSYSHQPFEKLSKKEILQDFENCFEIIEKNKLHVYNAVAYPFGNYPKNEPEKSRFFDILKEKNIKMGLRIGNKVNKFPFKNLFELTRIDILGQDQLWKFRLKLIFGKLKFF